MFLRERNRLSAAAKAFYGISLGKPGLTLSVTSPPGPDIVALQTGLRKLGYLASGLDGTFGQGTARAVRALQIDLLEPSKTVSRDGHAAFSIAQFNQVAGGSPPVTAVTGEVTPDLATCIAALLADPRAGWVPRSADPVGQNVLALRALSTAAGKGAPAPFMAAMVQQESGGRHFCIPTKSDPDDFVLMGLDRNDKASPDRITSRGYGLGQYTLFHHPATPTEIRDLVLDPARNVQAAFKELRSKFDGFVTGPSSVADDRSAELPGLALRMCRYPPSDSRYLSDCRACAREVPTRDIHRGTPVYPGASYGYQPDQYYGSAEYAGVPDRAAFLCDWPYAARRYDGSGNDSFHYQCRILLNLAAQPASGGT